jgi:hypothetical protein
MIAAALLLSQVAVPARVVELPEPSADSVVMQAVVRLPALGERELVAARVLAEVLPQGTEYRGLLGRLDPKLLVPYWPARSMHRNAGSSSGTARASEGTAFARRVADGLDAAPCFTSRSGDYYSYR